MTTVWYFWQMWSANGEKFKESVDIHACIWMWDAGRERRSSGSSGQCRACHCRLRTHRLCVLPAHVNKSCAGTQNTRTFRVQHIVTQRWPHSLLQTHMPTHTHTLTGINAALMKVNFGRSKTSPPLKKKAVKLFCNVSCVTKTGTHTRSWTSLSKPLTSAVWAEARQLLLYHYDLSSIYNPDMSNGRESGDRH